MQLIWLIAIRWICTQYNKQTQKNKQVRDTTKFNVIKTHRQIKNYLNRRFLRGLSIVCRFNSFFFCTKLLMVLSFSLFTKCGLFVAKVRWKKGKKVVSRSFAFEICRVRAHTEHTNICHKWQRMHLLGCVLLLLLCIIINCGACVLMHYYISVPHSQPQHEHTRIQYTRIQTNTHAHTHTHEQSSSSYIGKTHTYSNSNVIVANVGWFRVLVLYSLWGAVRFKVTCFGTN